MKITEYIAIYAAIIATSTFAWNVLTWRLNKRRLKLECRIVFLRGTEESPHAGDFVEYKLINLTDKPLRVNSISGTIKMSEGRGNFSLAGVANSETISPMDSTLFYKEAPHVFHKKLRSLYVEDSLGRKYKLKKSVLRKLKKKSKEYSKAYESSEDLIAFNPPLRAVD
ncbi:hypothetical protein NST69_16615 [Paenibacillus sp. FSL P2-0089]|uniref:hypothetical protein n=1 Tax=Paenibacillus sp. FSL P2-0089 TaxID=2954526 RepID=UPI00315A45C9